MNLEVAKETVSRTVVRVDDALTLEFDQKRWYSNEVLDVRLKKGAGHIDLSVSMEEATNAVTNPAKLEDKIRRDSGELER